MDMNFDDKRDRLAELDPEILLADGFEDALIGYAERACSDIVAVYDRNKCIECLIAEGCSHEDAVEHFEFNVVGSYVGEKTPIFITIFEKEYE